MLFVTESLIDGRWQTTGWRESNSLDAALVIENSCQFIQVPGVTIEVWPYRVRPATPVETAYATERNEFVSEHYTIPLCVRPKTKLGPI